MQENGLYKLHFSLECTPLKSLGKCASYKHTRFFHEKTYEKGAVYANFSFILLVFFFKDGLISDSLQFVEYFSSNVKNSSGIPNYQSSTHKRGETDSFK